MARLTIPTDLALQRKLCNDILKKHTDDAAASVLKGYLTENSIDLAKNAGAAATNAQTHYDLRMALERQSSKATEIRDIVYNSGSKNLKDAVQFLKKLYKANVHKLGDWGITVQGKDKIVYPAEIVDVANLIAYFWTRHTDITPAGSSPLESFIAENKIDVAKEKANAQKILDYDDESSKKAEAAARETREFENIWKPVVKNMTDIGNFLKELYPQNPRKVSDWGFNIDISDLKPKEVVSKLKLKEKITVGNVIIGSTFKNTGTTNLHVYKGKTTKGDPKIVHPNETLGIEKGMSTITVSNPNETAGGSFSALRSK